MSLRPQATGPRSGAKTVGQDAQIVEVNSGAPLTVQPNQTDAVSKVGPGKIVYTATHINPTKSASY